MTPPAKILVIKLSALGDMILAFPSFARIRAAHTDARISLLTTPPFASLMGRSPYFDAVEGGGRPGRVRDWVHLIGALRRGRYDRVYDLQTSNRTNLMFQALRPFPPAWSGIAKGCALPHRNPERMQMHSLERHAEQLRDAGIWLDAPTAPLSAPPPNISWMLGDVPQVPGEKPKTLLVPGSAGHRPDKRWPPQRYGDLAARLIDQGYDVDILGAAQDRPAAKIIRGKAPLARDLTGETDLFGIAALGASAALAVGNDTGPMHLIAAAGASCVALFSNASDPALSAPRGRVTVLRSPNLADLSLQSVLEACLTYRTPEPAQ